MDEKNIPSKSLKRLMGTEMVRFKELIVRPVFGLKKNIPTQFYSTYSAIHQLVDLLKMTDSIDIQYIFIVMVTDQEDIWSIIAIFFPKPCVIVFSVASRSCHVE